MENLAGQIEAMQGKVDIMGKTLAQLVAGSTGASGAGIGRVPTLAVMDSDIERTVRVFMGRIADRYPVDRAILFGSRARHTHSASSDVDIAVVLCGPHGIRSAAAINMAGIAFDVMLETGILVEALPLWDDELDHPERFSNPALIENIRREGVPL